MDAQTGNLKADRGRFGSGFGAVLVAIFGAVGAGFGALFFALAEQGATTFGEWSWAEMRWLVFVVMPLGLGVVLYLRDHFFVGTDGTGIPQTIAALKLGPGEVRERLFSIRVAVGKIILTTIGLFSQLSIGREGPSVQLGACLMHLAGKFAKFPEHLLQRGLILGGGAAGIAAAFNAPIAGIVFSMEEIGRSFEKENMGTVVRTVVIACLVTMLFLGNYYFYGQIGTGDVLGAQFLEPGPWIGLLIIGVVGGLLGGLFSTILLRLMPLVGRWIKRSFWQVALVFGLAGAGIAWISDGQTLGGGYEVAHALVAQGSPDYLESLPVAEREKLTEIAAQSGAEYPILRAIVSMLALLTGIPGGLFDPSFSIGAGIGNVVAPWLAWSGLTSQAVILLFIVSYFSGVVQSPMTSAIILVEMTGAVAMSIPLLAVAIVGYELSRRVCPVALYEALAERYLAK